MDGFGGRVRLVDYRDRENDGASGAVMSGRGAQGVPQDVWPRDWVVQLETSHSPLGLTHAGDGCLWLLLRLWGCTIVLIVINFIPASGSFIFFFIWKNTMSLLPLAIHLRNILLAHK